MKYIFFLCVLFFAACDLSGDLHPHISAEQSEKRNVSVDSSRWKQILPQQVQLVKDYVVKHKALFRQDIAFLIDMKIPSGRNRFFVVDLKSDSVLNSSLVAHGAGSEIPGTDSLQFSNTPNSYMSSLGNYRVGYSYSGQFGKAYKLYGLDASNSNAFKRLIVLHRYQCVPVYESIVPICNSLGCPMVSEEFFPVLERLIDAHGKSALLRIYY